MKARLQAIYGFAKGDVVNKRNFSHWITSPIRPRVGVDADARRLAPNRKLPQVDFVVNSFELVHSELRQELMLVYSVPLDTPVWDGEELLLVLLKREVVLIRNGEPRVLAGAAPARFKNLPGGGRVVFVELGSVHPKATSAGFVVCPMVH